MDLFDLYASITVDTGGAESIIEKVGSGISGLTSKFTNAGSGSDTLKNKLAVLTAQYETAQSKVEKLTSAFNKSVEETGATSEETQKLAQELNEAENEADDLKSEIDNLNGVTEESDSTFGTFQATLANLASEVITAVISKVKELASEFIDLGMETEEAFAKLETISGSENIDALTDSLTSLSNETGIASSELAETAYQAISAGTSAEDAAEMVETASKLATAGFTDSTTAVDVLTTAINAYGYSTEDATYLADTLITTQNLGKTTVDELASSMGKAIASGSAFNVSLENIEAAYIGLTSQGINTAEATTYVSSMIKELGDSSSDVATILQEETGQSFSQLMDSGYSLSDVLQILYDNVNGDTDALQNLWSSAEAGMASNALVQDGLENFNENLAAIASSAGTTEEAYETMTDTLSYKTSVLTAVGQNLMLAIYDGMSEKLGTVVDFASGILTKIYDAYTADGLSGVLQMGIDTLHTLSIGFEQGLPQLVAALPEVVNTILNYIEEQLPYILKKGVLIINHLVNGITSAIPELVAALPQIISSWTTFFAENMPTIAAAGGDILANLISGLLGAIPDLVAALPEIAAAFITWIGVFGETCVEIGGEILAGIVEGIIGGLPDLAEGVLQLGNEILNGIKSFFGISSPSTVMEEQGGYLVSGLINGISNMPAELASYLTESLNEVISWGANMASEALSAASNTLNNVISYISQLPGKILTQLNSALSNVTSFASTFVSKMQTAASNVLSTTVSYISQLPGKILTQLNSALSNAASFATNFVSKMKTAASNAVSGVITYISQLPSKVLSQLSGVTSKVSSWGTSLVTNFKNIGKNVINGMISGISSMVSSLYSSIKSALSGLVDKAKSALGISSPSKVFAEIGGYMAEGLDSGWSDEIEGVKDKVAEDLEFEAGSILTGATASSGFETETAGTGSLNDDPIVEALNAKFDQLMLVLEEYFPQFADIKMYLDGDTLVAETAEQMDIELGKVAARKARMA